MKVWIDDVRPPPDVSWVLCQDSETAILMIDSFLGVIEEISLDNDLGEGNGTGEDVMRFIEEAFQKKKKLPVIRCHSSNPVARRRIEAAISRLTSHLPLPLPRRHA